VIYNTALTSSNNLPSHPRDWSNRCYLLEGREVDRSVTGQVSAGFIVMRRSGGKLKPVNSWPLRLHASPQIIDPVAIRKVPDTQARGRSKILQNTFASSTPADLIRWLDVITRLFSYRPVYQHRAPITIIIIVVIIILFFK